LDRIELADFPGRGRKGEGEVNKEAKGTEGAHYRITEELEGQMDGFFSDK
jgi:hypothetical protein